jgi:hypothetical protein
VPTEILPLTPDLQPALLRFAERVWKRPRSLDFTRWRYEEPSFHRAFLAMRDGECLAMESAFRHPYRVGDEIVEFLEVFDWFCLPELRNSGLGVRIMQRYMQEPNPLLLIGGTADTQGLLPRLKWQIAGRSTRWMLPIGIERTAEALTRRARLPRGVARAAAPLVRRVAGWRPRRRFAPPGGRVVPVALPGEELLRLQRRPSAYGTVPLWTPELLRWLLAGFGGIGRHIPFYFVRDGALQGFALLRICPTEAGCDGEVIDLFAPDRDADLYAWMLSELVVVSDGFGAANVSARTTCPAVQAALRRLKFLELPSDPIQIWWPGHAGLPEPMLIGSNTGDVPILPIPEHWWEEATARQLATAPTIS